jgi:thiamine monophosphate synthase
MMMMMIVQPIVCYGWSSNNNNRARRRHYANPLRNNVYASPKQNDDTEKTTTITTAAAASSSSAITNFLNERRRRRNLLAIVTEPNSCESNDLTEKTWFAIQQAVSTNEVDIVCIRLRPISTTNGDGDMDRDDLVYERACTLTKRLVQLSSTSQAAATTNNDEASFLVLCSSDLVSVAVKARAHGVHVKEHHSTVERITNIWNQFEYPIIIGTSTHSEESAIRSYNMFTKYYENDDTRHDIRPNYYFVGTCYKTESHPDKIDLEGPELPGKIRRLLLEENQQQQQPNDKEYNVTNMTSSPPVVFAIGGIDDTNCNEPITLGADGVAVIRSVLQADDPARMVGTIHLNMKEMP